MASRNNQDETRQAPQEPSAVAPESPAQEPFEQLTGVGPAPVPAHGRHTRGAARSRRFSAAQACVILGACVLVVAVVVGLAWWRAQVDTVSTLGQAGLKEALEQTAGVEPTSAQTYAATGATVTTTLVVVDASDGALDAASAGAAPASDTAATVEGVTAVWLVVQNQSAQKTYLASLDPTACLVVGDAVTTVADALVANGVTGTVEPLAQALGISLEHAVVTTPAAWSVIETALNGDVSSVVSDASSILAALTSDMATTELANLASAIAAAGRSNLERLDVPLSNGYIDTPAFDVAIGVLA